jgi:hypothetical protein
VAERNWLDVQVFERLVVLVHNNVNAFLGNEFRGQPGPEYVSPVRCPPFLILHFTHVFHGNRHSIRLEVADVGKHFKYFFVGVHMRTT